MTLSSVNTKKTIEKKQNHPLKNKAFFGIPRHVAMRTDISDALYRLLTILYGSFGNDGHLEFKIDTLCKLMGGKAYSSVKRIIAQGRKLELFKTTQTGRSISFELIDSSNLKLKNELPASSKVSPQIAQKRAISYKEQKKGLKETTTPEPKKPPPKIPKNTPLADPVVVALISLIKNEYRDSIDSKLVLASIAKHGKGKTRDIIDRLNKATIDSSINGYLRSLIYNASDLIDYDERDRVKAQKEIENKRKLDERDKKIEELKINEAKKQDDIMQKYIVEYDNLDDSRKQSIFNRVLLKTTNIEKRDEIIEKGIAELTTIDGIAYRIKIAMGHMMT